MAVRVVYILDNKAPDLIEGAESWSFIGNTLKIWSKVGAERPMIEIMDAYVLSVEHVDNVAKAAPEPKAVENDETSQ